MTGLLPLFSYFLAAVALLTAGMAACALWRQTGVQRPRFPLDVLGEPRVFRFRDGYLVSSDRGTEFLLPHPVNRLTAWEDLITSLADLIPGADVALQRLAQMGEGFRLEGELGRDRLHLIGLRDGQELCISLATAHEGQQALRVDAQVLASLQAENMLLTQSHNASPSLAWVLDENDQVIWANGPYQDEVIRCHGTDAATAWPLQPLFPNPGTFPDGPTRRPIGTRDHDPAGETWYEVTICAPKGGVRHAHAQPIDRVIAAEDSLRNFIDTLTRTFTALPVGLAIFDARHKLMMFNPPMLDLTGLDGAWLASRPLLMEVLDSIRKRENISDPDGWSGWKARLREAQADAVETLDPWCECWSLPDGSSLRMTVNLQTDGAIALLLEDVSAEANLRQKTDTEAKFLKTLLETGRDAIIATDAGGIVQYTNERMAKLIGGDRPAPKTWEAVIRQLSSQCQSSPAWAELRKLGQRSKAFSPYRATIHLLSGAPLELRATYLGAGGIALHVVEALADDREDAPDIGPFRSTARLLLRDASDRNRSRAG